MAVNKQKGKRKGVRQQEHWAQYLVLIALMFAIAPTAVFFYRTLKPSAVVRASKSVQNQIRNMSSEATSTANGTSITFKKPRPVLRKLPSREQGEGEGVRVWRSIGRPEMRNLDPFLMLDEARVKPPAGFPDHPHRGFETVTYVLEGAMSHEDFLGNRGVIKAGDLQWMTAGRGMLHNGLPATFDENHALQLWVNLSAKDKMVPPAYQELSSSEIPEVEKDGVKVRVIAGTSMGTTSPIYTRTPTMFLDFTMQSGSEMHQPIPEGWNGFAYTLKGKATFGARDDPEVQAHCTVELGPGDGLSVWNHSGEECRFMLICGQPLNEPVAQYGPFVMNTREELSQAMQDYQYGKNGFEKAVGWKSAGSTLPGVKTRY